jgi:plastocyanin
VNKKVLLTTISWVGALAGLTLLALALTANTPVQAIMADSSVSVSVTESGFAPPVVTITVGTAVVWTNHTQETVHLVSGEPYRVCLPLVLCNASNTRVTATSPPMAGTVVTRQQGNWGSVDIVPGESYTHTFATAGKYPYFLAGHPDRTGLVVVQEAPPAPDFVLGVEPLAQEVAQGDSVTFTVAVTALHGFADSVVLDVGGVPAGAAVSWASNPLIPTADTTLTITPSMSTPADTNALVITGTGGGLVHSTPFTLTVLSGGIMPQPGTWSCSTTPGITIRFTVSADSRSVSDGYVRISCGSNSIPGPVSIADDEFTLTNSQGHISVAFDSDTHGQGGWSIFLSSSCWAMGTMHCSP